MLNYPKLNCRRFPLNLGLHPVYFFKINNKDSRTKSIDIFLTVLSFDIDQEKPIKFLESKLTCYQSVC